MAWFLDGIVFGWNFFPHITVMHGNQAVPKTHTSCTAFINTVVLASLYRLFLQVDIRLFRPM
jgi:hypothetical protein